MVVAAAAAAAVPWWWGDAVAVLLASGVLGIICSKCRCFCRKNADGRCECGAGYISENVSIIPGEKIENNCCCHGVCKSIEEFIEIKAKQKGGRRRRHTHHPEFPTSHSAPSVLDVNHGSKCCSKLKQERIQTNIQTN